MNTRPSEIVEACDWTRPRLPLLVGMGRGAESAAEGGDLSGAERRRVRVHLDDCAACRSRWSALVRSTAALSAAAAESPVEPYGPSLWEGLSARIEAAESARPSVWGRIRRTILTDRLVRRLDRGLGGLPLQLAWLRDTIAHDLPDQARALFDRDARASIRLIDRLAGAWGSPVGLAATVAFGAFLAALSLLHQAETTAGVQIVAASAPTPTPIRPETVPLVLAPSRPKPAAPPTTAPAEPATAEPEALAQNTAPLQPPPPATPPAARPAASPTYDYDLERGVPMPPDARIAKPAY